MRRLAIEGEWDESMNQGRSVATIEALHWTQKDVGKWHGGQI